MNRVSIIGSTGSIGTQALDAIAMHPDVFSVIGLMAGSNITLLAEQARRFKPEYIAVADRGMLKALKNIDTGGAKIIDTLDPAGDMAALPCADTVLISCTGIAGLMPLIAAIKAKKRIALANKESIVCAGEIVTRMLDEEGVAIYPVDSEHSAIFQTMQGTLPGQLKRIILTASGGPFREYSMEDMRSVTPEQALLHPNWNMGKKVTIDSATMMNKGLEVIEARWLFRVRPEMVDVIIHPESIIHSMVELMDNSVLAQMSVPDMRIPIQYALGYPDRHRTEVKRLDFTGVRKLTFEAPDTDRFPCLGLAYEALRRGGTVPAVLNAANEVAVQRFLEHKLKFYGISDTIEKCMDRFENVKNPKISDIFDMDRACREYLCK